MLALGRPVPLPNHELTSATTYKTPLEISSNDPETTSIGACPEMMYLCFVSTRLQRCAYGSYTTHILGRGMTGFTSTTKICNLHAARSTVTVQSPDSADTRQVRRVFCRTNDCSLALCLLTYSCVLAYVKNDRTFLGCQN